MQSNEEMRQNPLDEHNDQETISLLYISIIIYIHAQQEQLMTKNLTFGKI